MTVKCERCGAEIEIADGTICPACHDMSAAAADALLQASKDKDFVPLQTHEIEQCVASPVWMQNKALQSPLTQTKSQWRGIFVALAILAMFMLVLVIAQFILPSSNTSDSASTTAIAAGDNEPFTPVVVGFGEQAFTERYFVVCDGIERIKEYPKDAPDGYMYVAIHLLVTNRSDERRDVREPIVVHTNGIQCEEHAITEALKGFDNTMAEPHSTIEGTVCFMVPERVDEMKIQYGKNVTIVAKI